MKKDPKYLYQRVLKFIREKDPIVVFKKLKKGVLGELNGFESDQLELIEIDFRQNDEERAQTLIHEILHFLLPKEEDEEIERLTKLIWSSLSEKQKEYLIFKLYLQVKYQK